MVIIAQGIERCLQLAALLLSDSDVIDIIEGLNHLCHQFAFEAFVSGDSFRCSTALVFILTQKN